uniref:Uncharacterized protein n=1 Tax=Kalanchoe fedtschenkoi TaxID=63787 RepID=A0A7N0VGH2_KALFE
MSKVKALIKVMVHRGHFKTPHKERLRLHWDNLATDAAESLFINSPNEAIAFRRLLDKSPDNEENPGSLASLFPDNILQAIPSFPSINQQ